MSRTDAHAPYRVRVARREITVVSVHRCAGRECDLPALSPAWTTGRIGSCYREFAYTGTSVCSCWMCHWHSKPERRRAAVRIDLRALARAWNGGDHEVAFEV